MRPRPGASPPPDVLFSLVGRLFWILFPAFLLFAAVDYCLAQTAETLSQIKKIYVEPLGHGKTGDEFRDRMILRLRKDSGLEVVGDPKLADAVIRGTSQIWITGYISSNPRTPSAARHAVYSGYVSARVVGENNQTLWSYLVTPSKFPWGGIVHDMADALAARFLEARREKSEGGAATPAPDAAPMTLHGAGATFPAPLYEKWFESFQGQNPNQRVTYDAVGSGDGIQLLAEGKVDFAASDMPLSDQEISQRGLKLLHFPSVLGAVVPIYHLEGVRRVLNFTPETLAEIYLGKIRRWNDPKIRNANRGLALPDSEIVVMHRSDSSGTTFVWSDFLSKVSPAWKTAIGAGAELKWPVGNGAEHNEGVAEMVQQTPNSIGYVEMVYALQHELNYGAVRNAAGAFVRADLASVTAAATGAGEEMKSDFRVSITNAPGAAAYPIASFTWLLFPEKPEKKDSAKQAAQTKLLQWILTSGQKECAELGYAPLPRAVANRELQALSASE
jgi:phosphate transport system substrate-binding protein